MHGRALSLGATHVMARTGLAAIMALALALALALAWGAPQRSYAAEAGSQDTGLAAASVATASTKGKVKAASAKKAKFKKPGKAKLAVCKSRAAGKIALRASKVKGASGYQFKIARNRSFTSAPKVRTLAKRTKTVGGLWANRVYYCKVRAYSERNGKRKYGAWSAARVVKTRMIKIACVDVHPSTTSQAGGWLRRNGCHVVGVSTFGGLKPACYDGLVIPGGADVDPAFYGAKRHPRTYGVNRFRDKLQMKAIQKFAKAGKPVIGICRGEQVLNVAFGGSLIQHIPGRHGGGRTVTIQRGTWLYDMFGSSESVTHSHHQCVKRLGKGLVATQWDARDGHIEAVEHVSLPVYGLQWHPENMGARGSAVAHRFMKVCIKYSVPLKK